MLSLSSSRASKSGVLDVRAFLKMASLETPQELPQSLCSHR